MGRGRRPSEAPGRPARPAGRGRRQGAQAEALPVPPVPTANVCREPEVLAVTPNRFVRTLGRPWGKAAEIDGVRIRIEHYDGSRATRFSTSIAATKVGVRRAAMPLQVMTRLIAGDSAHSPARVSRHQPR